MHFVTNHQGNANQNHHRLTRQDGFIKKQQKRKPQNQKTASAGEDVEELGTLGTVGGNARWCSCYGKQYGGSSQN